MVLHCQHRKFNTAHAADFASPQTAGVYDMLGMNRVVFVCDDIPCAVGAVVESSDPSVCVNLSATIFGTNCVSVRNAIRVDAAFIFVVKCAHKIFLFEQWVQNFCFFDRDDLHFHAEVAATSMCHFQPVESLWCVCKLNATWQVNAAVLARFFFDFFIEIDRVLLQASHVGVAVECVHAACGVPC